MFADDGALDVAVVLAAWAATVLDGSVDSEPPYAASTVTAAAKMATMKRRFRNTMYSLCQPCALPGRDGTTACTQTIVIPRPLLVRLAG